MDDITFDDLKPGDHACIISCENCPLRFLEMGLTPGTEVVLERISPFGDTIFLGLRGHYVAVRKSECCLKMQKKIQ